MIHIQQPFQNWRGGAKLHKVCSGQKLTSVLGSQNSILTMALPTGSYCTSYMVVSYFTTVLLHWYYILQCTIGKHGWGYELVINMDSPFQTSYREYKNDFVVKILPEIMQKLVKSKCGDESNHLKSIFSRSLGFLICCYVPKYL